MHAIHMIVSDHYCSRISVIYPRWDKSSTWYRPQMHCNSRGLSWNSSDKLVETRVSYHKLQTRLQQCLTLLIIWLIWLLNIVDNTYFPLISHVLLLKTSQSCSQHCRSNRKVSATRLMSFYESLQTSVRFIWVQTLLLPCTYAISLRHDRFTLRNLFAM